MRLAYNDGFGGVILSGSILMSRPNRHRMARSSAFALLVSTFLLSSAHADEPGFKPIFNGKDLAGWRLGQTDLTGRTASDDGRFAVEGGVLVVAGSKDTPPRMTEIDTAPSAEVLVMPMPAIMPAGSMGPHNSVTKAGKWAVMKAS